MCLGQLVLTCNTYACPHVEDYTGVSVMCHYTCYAFRSYLAWGSSLQVDSQPHAFCSSSIFKRIPEMASSASLELGIMILSQVSCQVSCWVPLVLGVALGVMSDVSYVFKYHDTCNEPIVGSDLHVQKHSGCIGAIHNRFGKPFISVSISMAPASA